MTIRIRETPWTNAAGTATLTVAPDTVRANLMLIASGGTADLAPSFGDEPDPADVNWSVIQYEPTPAPGNVTEVDRVRTRLKQLVDDASSNYEVIGIDGNVTVWSNGATVETQAAYALGDTIFYDTTDCKGHGRWIWATDGTNDCSPPSIVLYHEFAHGFRNHGPGDPQSEEAEAVDDENVFRAAQGLKSRDRNRLEAGCGCPSSGCCIIATVATGSPTSKTVQRLRWLRDHELRRTRLGKVLFDRIHEEYYAFSIDVARNLALNSTAQDEVRELLVDPLLAALELFAACRRAPGSDLERVLADTVDRFSGDGTSRRELAGALLAVINDANGTESPDGISQCTIEAARTVGRRLPGSPHLRWGLIEPLAALVALVGAHDAEVTELVYRYDEWLTRVPLDAALATLADPAAALEEFTSYAARDAATRLTLNGQLQRRRELRP